MSMLNLLAFCAHNPLTLQIKFIVESDVQIKKFVLAGDEAQNKSGYSDFVCVFMQKF